MAIGPRPGRLQTQVVIPLAGAVVGGRHVGASGGLFHNGHSLHPLQRIGAVGHPSMPVMQNHALPGPSHGPAAGGPDLAYPPILSIGLARSGGRFTAPSRFRF